MVQQGSPLCLAFSNASETPCSSGYRAPFSPMCTPRPVSPACQAQLLLVSQFLTCSSPSTLTCVPSPPGLRVLVSLLGSRFWSLCAVLLPTCFLLGGDVLLLSQTPRRSVQVPQRQPYQTLLLSSPVWPRSPLPSSIPSFLLCLCGHDFPAFFLLTPVSSSGLPRCCLSPRPGLAFFHQCSSPSPSTGKSGSFPSPVARRLWSEGEEGQVSALSPMGWTGGGLHPHPALLPDGVGSAQVPSAERLAAKLWQVSAVAFGGFYVWVDFCRNSSRRIWANEGSSGVKTSHLWPTAGKRQTFSKTRLPGNVFAWIKKDLHPQLQSNRLDSESKKIIKIVLRQTSGVESFSLNI